MQSWDTTSILGVLTCVLFTVEAKDEKFMSSSGLEATQQELDAFGSDNGIDDDDEDDQD